MLGAIIGDVVGSRFEFNNIKTKKFDLFDKKCKVTDDSVMSVAVAERCLNGYVPDNTPQNHSNLQKMGSALSLCRLRQPFLSLGAFQRIGTI